MRLAPSKCFSACLKVRSIMLAAILTASCRHCRKVEGQHSARLKGTAFANYLFVTYGDQHAPPAASCVQKNSTMVATELLNRPPPAHQRRFFEQAAAEAEAEAAAGAAVAAVPAAVTDAAQSSKAGTRQPGRQSTIDSAPAA
jgi:hypothetical protein